VNEAARAVNHLVERLCRWQAGEHHVGLRADIGGRTRRHAADFFELGERAAAIADDAIAAFDQIIRNRQADFADADQTNRVHDRFQLSLHFDTLPLIVIARSDSDDTIQFFEWNFLDCFALLAMTTRVEPHVTPLRRTDPTS
jgi:hypothetical protein